MAVSVEMDELCFSILHFYDYTLFFIFGIIFT
jgi:hypothetical protein